jgi:hypothetical protein
VLHHDRRRQAWDVFVCQPCLTLAGVNGRSSTQAAHRAITSNGNRALVSSFGAKSSAGLRPVRDAFPQDRPDDLKVASLLTMRQGFSKLLLYGDISSGLLPPRLFRLHTLGRPAVNHSEGLAMPLRKSCLPLLLAVCAAAYGQDQPTTFEVASVRISPPVDRSKPPNIGCSGGPATTDPAMGRVAQRHRAVRTTS